MLVHFVLFKLIAEDEEAKKEARDAIEAALKKVPKLKEPEFGQPALPQNSKGYDFGFFARFADRAALKEHADSDEHKKAQDVILPRVKSGETLDYDLEY
ncbi:hypothetical protein RSOLAG22IIIB_08358 [Rhizoctonia solani]|uniref:Stress-response A/B barrel domain-containing protein n=1 Tax=Rhizoctonia solani TaxID=456999 RepID=A0A0K6FTA0_9AGAM|nr:hypothetical protein RSOLAG22IIIB_08358 [Rhizoctonia solani]